MSDSIESLNRKIESAGKIGTVVRCMKAIAASNRIQYEMAVNSLEAYYRTVILGFTAYFTHNKLSVPKKTTTKQNRVRLLIIGSDIGLVGQFNDRLADYAAQALSAFKGNKEIWAVGERIYSRLEDAGVKPTKLFMVPNSVNGITKVVGEIIIESEKNHFVEDLQEFYVFHNHTGSGKGYSPMNQRLLPLDEKWLINLSENKWPTVNVPQVTGESRLTLSALLREYLFVSLFRVCAESLAAENTSRLEAMQRAEKSIEDLLEDLRGKFNRLRQDLIDEEIFDVIAGFEALSKEERNG